MQNFSVLAGALSITLGIVFWVKLPKGTVKSCLKTPDGSWVASCLLGVSALCFNLGITTLLSRWFPGADSSQSAELAKLMNDTLGKIIVAVLVLGVAPFLEELLFRGILIDGFKVLWSRSGRVALSLSAILFAVSHGINHFPGGFLFAFYLGQMRIRSGSIRNTVLVHSLNNFFGLSLIYFQLPALSLGAGSVLTACGVISTLVYYTRFRGVIAQNIEIS